MEVYQQARFLTVGEVYQQARFSTVGEVYHQAMFLTVGEVYQQAKFLTVGEVLQQAIAILEILMISYFGGSNNIFADCNQNKQNFNSINKTDIRHE